jgi:hypothetical protein
MFRNILDDEAACGLTCQALTLLTSNDDGKEKEMEVMLMRWLSFVLCVLRFGGDASQFYEMNSGWQCLREIDIQQRLEKRRWTGWQSSSSLLLRSWQKTQLTLSKLKAHKVSPSVVNWHMIIYPFNNKSIERGTSVLNEIFRQCRYTIRPLVTIYSVSQSNKYRCAVCWRWCRYLELTIRIHPIDVGDISLIYNYCVAIFK